MIINHLGITFSDVGLASSFLAAHFGLEPLGKASTKMGHLRDESGFILSLFRSGLLGAEPTTPATTHIGFMLADRAAVDAKHAILTDAGYAASAPEDMHGHTFTVTAPGGFAIEVVT